MQRVVTVFAVSMALAVSTAWAAPTGRYKAALEKLTALQQQYPTFSQIFTIGTNNDGEEIKALRISTTPQAMDPKKIGMLVVATHHGNESDCPRFSINVATEILKKYARRDYYRNNLADTEWTIIPVLNIPGYNANNRYEKGEDPNRDYPGICSGTQGGRLKSIKTMMEFLTTRTFTGSVTVHGYMGALTYPWGVSVEDTHTLDHNQFDTITRKAAEKNGYRYGTSTDIVYPCEGSFEDYAYWKHGIWSLLIEMKSGNDTDIKKSTDAILTYFDQLDSSPSTHHTLESKCTRSNKPDLGNE